MSVYIYIYVYLYAFFIYLFIYFFIYLYFFNNTHKYEKMKYIYIYKSVVGNIKKQFMTDVLLCHVQLLVLLTNQWKHDINGMEE